MTDDCEAGICARVDFETDDRVNQTAPPSPNISRPASAEPAVKPAHPVAIPPETHPESAIELPRTRQRIEAAYDELEADNARLRTAIRQAFTILSHTASPGEARQIARSLLAIALDAGVMPRTIRVPFGFRPDPTPSTPEDAS